MRSAAWSTNPTATADATPSAPAPHRDEEKLPLAVRNGGRVLAAVAGVAASAAMLVVGGLYALLYSCVDYGGATAVCDGMGMGVIEPLELVAVLGGAGAALVGAVATAASGKVRWIAIGLATTIGLAGLLAVLVTGQTAALH